MTRPAEIAFADLLELPSEDTELWVQPSVRQRVQELMPFKIGKPPGITAGTQRLIVVGSGALLDLAKARRADENSQTRLIAVPSLWGSGAEVSPIVVRDVDGRKEIRMGARFLPDQVAYCPELAEQVPDSLARWACGDSWSHALEGFLSPLADDELRGELAGLMRRMLAQGVSRHPAWFALSADACAAQARSSVGLVHGIAHTVEAPLRVSGDGWGHARLCSTFLWPVMAFNAAESEGKANQLMRRFGVDLQQILQVARELYDEPSYREALPHVVANWRSILRDPCTRTNVRLVRPADLEALRTWAPR